MRFLLAYLLVILLFVSCSSSKQVVNSGVVKQAESSVPTHHGLWYHLPKTVIKVEMVAEKRVYKAGPFYRYAQRFLNISDVITQDKEEWVLVDAEISTYGKADEMKLFSVTTTGQPGLSALHLAEDGVLLSVNQSVIENEPVVNNKVPSNLISLKSVNFNETPYSEEQLIKTSTAAMAEEVAKEIYQLRELRKELLQGELELLPPDGLAYKEALSHIDLLEKSYMQLFIGKVEIQRVSKYYDYIPEGHSSSDDVLLRFSDKNGFLDVKDVSGTPVYIEVEVKNAKVENLVSAEDVKDKSNRGLVYCQPALGVVNVIDRTLLLSSKEVSLAQFGQMLRLPADLLETQNVGVILDSSTGALKKIVVN